MEKTQAILIDRLQYGETSLIVTWCAADAGIFKTLAKGALRPKSPFSGRLDLFASAEVRHVRSRRGDLHILAEVQLTDARMGLRKSYGRVLAATYFVKRITEVVEREAPIPAIHELLDKALDYLAGKDPNAPLLARFEQRLAEELGVAGPEAGNGNEAIQHAFHRPPPVQRAQLLKWLREHEKPPQSGSRDADGASDP